MSPIDIIHPHPLPQDQARQALDDIAASLRERFGVNVQWQDGGMHFSASGVDGTIALEPGQLHLRAELGFPLSLMQESIETRIRDLLQRRFGQA
ncbi:MAG: polyhydroxyalkanoic acid system family protein [Pseudoxanthomonas suwonensis]|nr:polyhydroxyalkanoic acid system family protein [Pseudoxanthomonas suwonensis]